MSQGVSGEDMMEADMMIMNTSWGIVIARHFFFPGSGANVIQKRLAERAGA